MGIALEKGMESSVPNSPVASLPLDGSVVEMKGLPFKAGSEDVLRFYGGFSIKTHNIYLKRHPDGRPRWRGGLKLMKCDVTVRDTGGCLVLVQPQQEKIVCYGSCKLSGRGGSGRGSDVNFQQQLALHLCLTWHIPSSM